MYVLLGTFLKNYIIMSHWILCENKNIFNLLSFQNDREHKPVQPWALICDTLLSRNLKVGTIFQLRQGTDVSLLCEIHPLPHFSISEEVIDHRTNRFLLRQNSETPVWKKTVLIFFVKKRSKNLVKMFQRLFLRRRKIAQITPIFVRFILAKFTCP